MKSAKNYWDLFDKISKTSEAKLHDKCFEACEEMKNFLPCNNNGYFYQNICITYNGKPKRLFDYELYEKNREILKRFWNQAFNKPLY
jgi:hypothetical protein